MTDSTNRVINSKLVILLVVLVVAIGGAAFTFLNPGADTGRQNTGEIDKEQASAAYKAFLAHVDNTQANLVKTLTTQVVTKEEFLRLLAQRDADRLLALSKPLLEGMKGSQRITHTYFVDPDGNVLLRTHRPEDRGGKLTRKTFRQAKETGKVAAGIELGKKWFTMRAIQPVEYNGKHIGYIEIGEEIDHIFSEFKDDTGNDVALFLLDTVIKEVGSEVKGSKLAGFSVVEGSDKQLAVEVGQQVDVAKGLTAFEATAVKSSKGDYLVGIGPFKDATGKVVGVLMIQTDISALPRGHKSRS